MTAVTAGFSQSSRDSLGRAGFLLAAVVIGVLTGINPALGIVVGAALLFALIVIRDLALGVCLFLLVSFLDVVSQNQDLSVTKGAGAVLAGAWLAAIATGREPRRGLSSQNPWLVIAVLGFLGWSAMSTSWAESQSVAFRSTSRFALDAMLIPIVFWAVRERKHVVWVFGVLVVAVLVSVLWGITAGKVAGSTAARQPGRLSGATVEANELAQLLIVCIIFSISLALVLKRAPTARILAVAAAIAAIAALFGTFSREGILALGVVILVGCFYGGRMRPAFLALAVGVLLVGSVFLQTTTSDAVQRLTSANTSGRTDIWKVGLRMVRANPVLGVGSGNYTVVEPHYLLTSPGTIQRVDYIVDRPHVAHNIYLQILAEMGVIGLALFLSVIVLSVRACVKAVKLFRARGDRSSENLGRAVCLAITGMLAADFFGYGQYSKQFWLLLALGPALLALARRSERYSGSPDW